MEQVQNTSNIVFKHFMVLYGVFVTSVGLNNNTEYYKLKSTGSDLDRSRLTAENDWIGADTDPQYRIDASLILTLFAHYICLHGYIHFIYLFNPNTKCRDMYSLPQIRTKIQIYTFLLIFPSTTLKKCAFGHILLDSLSCGLRREAKSLFFPNSIYAF